jgi:hypothetical protein
MDLSGAEVLLFLEASLIHCGDIRTLSVAEIVDSYLFDVGHQNV